MSMTYSEAAPATVSGSDTSVYPLGNREGRSIATIRKPGDLPLRSFPHNRAGCPEGKLSLLE